MSILSTIGLQPPPFATGGGGQALIYYIPSAINIKSPSVGSIFTNLAIPNGTYLVSYNFPVDTGDFTTLVKGLVITVRDSINVFTGSATDTTVIYGDTVTDFYTFTVGATSMVTITSGFVTCEYALSQTGNTTSVVIVGSPYPSSVSFIPL